MYVQKKESTIISTYMPINAISWRGQRSIWYLINSYRRKKLELMRSQKLELAPTTFNINYNIN